MPGPSPDSDVLTIVMPAGLVPTDGTQTLSLHIATDKNQKRLLSRSYRDDNTDGPGRIRRVEYEIGGLGIGRSLQSTAGGLGVDVVENLETRWDRQLTSSLAQTFVNLATDDPPGINGSLFGVSIFGTAYFGSPLGGGTSGLGPDVTHFAEQNGYLLVGRGSLLTQVDLATWTVIETLVLGAPILDMDHWFGNVYIALGPTTAMQRVVAASALGMVLEDVVATSPAGTIYASSIKRGSDRAWYVDADQSGSTYNFVGYTLDAFVTLAFPFQVGDPMAGVNGLGPYNSLLAVGEVDSIYTTTDAGKSVPLSRALDTIHSTMNGSSFADPGFGWNYYLSIAGLRAHTFSGIDNPIGIGERMRSFTGHNGICTAIIGARGELWATWRTSAGDTFGYRGQFAGQETGSSGNPTLFPWYYAANDYCGALFATDTPNPASQNMTVIRASGTNLYHQTIAANGMDNLASLTYSTAGGSAYLTTLDKNPSLLKTVRLVRVRDFNWTSGSSWTVACAFDANPNAPLAASYTSIGSIAANGPKTITPTAGGTDAQGNPTPTANISGYTIKPRITQVAAGSGASTNPPTLVGTLELEYDERPEQVEEIHVSVKIEQAGLSANQIWDHLRELVGSTTTGPFRIQLPDDLPPAVSGSSGGGQKYAMLQSVLDRTDLAANVGVATLILHAWPMADALS